MSNAHALATNIVESVAILYIVWRLRGLNVHLWQKSPNFVHKSLLVDEH